MHAHQPAWMGIEPSAIEPRPIHPRPMESRPIEPRPIEGGSGLPLESYVIWPNALCGMSASGTEAAPGGVVWTSVVRPRVADEALPANVSGMHLENADVL